MAKYAANTRPDGLCISVSIFNDEVENIMKRSIELLRFKTDRGSGAMATFDMKISVACSTSSQDLKLKQWTTFHDEKVSKGSSPIAKIVSPKTQLPPSPLLGIASKVFTAVAGRLQSVWLRLNTCLEEYMLTSVEDDP